MKTLIIYNIVTERTLVAVADLTVEEYELLKPANGARVNIDVCTDEQINAVDAIGYGFCKDEEQKEYCHADLDLLFFGRFEDQYMQPELDASGVEAVIACEFYP